MVDFLRIDLSARIDGETPVSIHVDRAVPPDYDAADIKAFTIRAVEDTAFTFTRQRFGRSATLSALVAAAARLAALQAIVDALPMTPVRAQLQAIFDLTNDQATAQYGDDPDGP